MGKGNVFIGHLSTRYFDFYFVADSYESLLQKAEAMWNEHRAKTGATDHWETVQEDLWFRSMPINSGHKR